MLRASNKINFFAVLFSLAIILVFLMFFALLMVSTGIWALDSLVFNLMLWPGMLVVVLGLLAACVVVICITVAMIGGG